MEDFKCANCGNTSYTTKKPSIKIVGMYKVCRKCNKAVLVPKNSTIEKTEHIEKNVGSKKVTAQIREHSDNTSCPRCGKTFYARSWNDPSGCPYCCYSFVD